MRRWQWSWSVFLYVLLAAFLKVFVIGIFSMAALFGCGLLNWGKLPNATLERAFNWVMTTPLRPRSSASSLVVALLPSIFNIAFWAMLIAAFVAAVVASLSAMPTNKPPIQPPESN